jgi:hypothetical protein
MLVWGSAFLTLTFAGSILHLVSPERWSWKMSAATGGLGLLQVVASFFSRPMRDLQSNLNNLASLRMVLESHSLKTAFTRFHLTTPEVLRELKDAGDISHANAQITALESQLAVIDRFQASDYASLAKVAGLPEDNNANGDANGRGNPDSRTSSPSEPS